MMMVKRLDMAACFLAKVICRAISSVNAIGNRLTDFQLAMLSFERAMKSNVHTSGFV